MKRFNIGKKKGLAKKVTFGFEMHGLEAASKKRSLVKEADVILVEHPPKTIKRIKKYGAKKAASYYQDIETNEKFFRSLEEEMKKGKKVIGYDKPSPLAMLKLRKSDKFVLNNIIGQAKSMSEFSEMRDKKNIKKIMKEIKKNEGKTLFIEAGAMHTPLYHEVKRILRQEEKLGKIKIERKFLNEERFEKGVKIRHNPIDQIGRMFRFKKGRLTERDMARIRELAKQDEKFFSEQLNLIKKYKKQGMSSSQAFEESYYNIMKKRKSTKL